MQKNLDVICLGRAAVDLYGEQLGAPLEDMRSFAKYVGGSSGNMAIGLAKLGLKVGLVSRVGDEHMGRFVRNEFIDHGVDVTHLTSDPDRLTGLVILGIKDRETFPLVFYRKDCADMAIPLDAIDEDYISRAKALVITGTHFSTREMGEVCIKALKIARRLGVKTVLDIDYRPVLWGVTSVEDGETRFVSSDSVTNHIKSFLPLFDLIVGTEEEFHIAAGVEDNYDALQIVRSISDATLVLKKGSDGCQVFDSAIPSPLESGGVSATPFKVEVLNVLGAGDAFISGFLLGWVNGEPLATCCAYANGCGALVVTRHGCAPAIPNRQELEYFIDNYSRINEPAAQSKLAYLQHSGRVRKNRERVYALAFDHRIQLEEMAETAGVAKADVEPRIKQAKSLIFSAAKTVAQERGFEEHLGILACERFGESVLEDASGTGIWIGRPVELPKSRPIEFEYGDDLSRNFNKWPTEQIVKCLVFYHPDDSSDMKQVQDARILALSEACIESGNELLLEIILPSDQPAKEGDIVKVLRHIYELGVTPDWWKLAAPSDMEWDQIEELIEHYDPKCRGVVILGLDRPMAELREGFVGASGRRYCRGFAIGRTIFGQPMSDWFSGAINDEQLVEKVSSNFSEVVSAWEQAVELDASHCPERVCLS